MEKILYLIRHGKARPTESGEKDFDRLLEPEGMRQATRLGSYLYKNDVMISAIITSKAIRAIESAEQVASQLGFDVSKIIQDDELFEASVRILLERVSSLMDLWNQVIIVGHNPTLSYFAEYITGHHFDGMEPGSLVKITCGIDSWKELGAGMASFEAYITSEDISQTP